MAEIVGDRSHIDPRSGFCKSNRTFYSKRNPVALPPNEFLDVTTFISSRAHRGKVAFIDAATGRHLTFADLWLAVEAVSGYLTDEFGIRKGHVVLLLSPNSIYFPIACLAVISLGAVITTTNPLNTSGEIAKQIADSKPVLAFTIPELIPKIANFNLPIVLLGSQAIPSRKPNSNGLQLVSSIEEMMRREPSQRRVKERIYQGDKATLLYSSGTTGASKGVVSSHRNFITMAEVILSRFQSDRETETFVCTIPMFHIYGLVSYVIGLIAAGSTTIILSRFEMNDMLTAIQKFSATYLPLVPPIIVALVNNAETYRKNYDLSSLRSVLSGGAPLSKEVTEEFIKLYPNVMLLQGYGLTESTAVGSSVDTPEESQKYGSAGLLSPNMEAKIVDPESGEPLSVNQMGELWLKGPTIMKGYFRNEKETASTLDSNGWLRSGDLCYIDEDGFLFVVDRLKELIKYKGYQVPPAELEALLLSHPEIGDAAVIPFPDMEAGQVPMAYVVRKVGSAIAENEIVDFITKQVAPYKKIRRVAFVASIPKNPSGKILRKDLIHRALSKM